MLRTRRREAVAAVAGEDGGDAMPARGGREPVPAKLGVVVGVGVEEAGGDGETVGVDHALGRPADLADADDAALAHGDTAIAGVRARSVHDAGVFNQDIDGHGVPLRPSTEASVS